MVDPNTLSSLSWSDGFPYMFQCFPTHPWIPIYIYVYIFFFSRCFLAFKPQLKANFGSFRFGPLPGRREWRGAHALPGRAQRLERHMPSRGPERCALSPQPTGVERIFPLIFTIKTPLFPVQNVFFFSPMDFAMVKTVSSRSLFGFSDFAIPKKSIMKHGMFEKTRDFPMVFFARLGDPEGSHGYCWAAGDACVGAPPRSTRRGKSPGNHRDLRLKSMILGLNADE